MKIVLLGLWISSSVFASHWAHLGDFEFKRRKSPTHAFRAYYYYRFGFRLEPDNAELAWKTAMASHHIAFELTREKEIQKKLFRFGAQQAERVLEARPDCGECYFWAAINFVRLGEVSGILKSASLLPQVLEYLRKASKLSPGHAYAGAFRVLGAIYERLPGMMGGSKDLARRYYEKALAHSPSPLNYLALAKLSARSEILIEGTKVVPSEDEMESFQAWLEMKQILAGA